MFKRRTSITSRDFDKKELDDSYKETFQTVMNFDVSERTGGTIAKPKFKLKRPLRISGEVQVLSTVLTPVRDIQWPYNQIKVFLWQSSSPGASDPVTHTLTIPTGNYTEEELAQALSQKLKDVNPLPIKDIAFKYDNFKKKFLFDTRTSNYYFYVFKDFNPDRNMSNLLGFADNPQPVFGQYPLSNDFTGEIYATDLPGYIKKELCILCPTLGAKRMRAYIESKNGGVASSNLNIIHRQKLDRYKSEPSVFRARLNDRSAVHVDECLLDEIEFCLVYSHGRVTYNAEIINWSIEIVVHCHEDYN